MPGPANRYPSKEYQPPKPIEGREPDEEVLPQLSFQQVTAGVPRLWLNNSQLQMSHYIIPGLLHDDDQQAILLHLFFQGC